MPSAIVPVQTDSRSQPPAIAPKADKIERVTGKVRVAIDLMVWSGSQRADAAQKAGISEHGLYKALRKPPVKAYYMAQLDVLRTSERARNIHTLVEVRDQTTNQMARVQAVARLEQIDDEAQVSRGSQALPGLQIVIVQGGVNAPLSPNDGKPLITLNRGPDDGGDRG
jgi:hypothetical protein